MTFFRASARVLAVAALAGLCACAGSSGGSGPTASLTLLPSATTVRNDGVPVTILASAVNATGTPGSGTVTFVAAFGALTDSGGAPANTATLAADGTATINYACNIAVDSRCVAGNVFISGSWTSAGKTVQLSISNVAAGSDGGTPPPSSDGGTPPPPAGTPPGAPSSIAVTASGPFVLGLEGSGIQEHGSIAYLVTDSLGIPVPGVTVNFALQAPALGVTLLHPSGVTDLNGAVTAAYTSGTQVGVTALTATVATTGATVSQAIAVRGAKPSANGFYFHCEHASLPVYTSIAEFETMTCTVRLTDRYGNRVGIPTVVSFATEAGAIAASVTTQGFKLSNPSDPAEGTATVTFTSDTGNGNEPADVAPLGPTAAQFPWPRTQEPSYTLGSLTVNPRDQLVTLIAMTRGEEAFEDANGDGVFTAGEAFVDQGDPFVDANDNSAYDPAPASGLAEIRFCGLNADCSTYHGPNGVWDADTVIWKPTWVVFTGAGVPSAIPNTLVPIFAPPKVFDTGTTPGSDCAEYADAAFNASHSSSISAPVFAYDRWLNLPAAGTSSSMGSPTSSKLTTTGFGFGTLLESWGSMGVLGFDFDWVRVSAADNTLACSAATSPCIEKLVFGNFVAPAIGSILITNTTTVPTASDPLGAGSFGCPPNPPLLDSYGNASFLIDVTVTNAHGVKATTLLAGRYARGTGK
ncbi:MAG TPA: Ig-like domain-containing protein [Myxococcales bacterium]